MWTLIIFIYTGMFAKSDSVALTNIPGFTSEASCIAAAEKSKNFVKDTAKEFRFTCVKQ